MAPIYWDLGNPPDAHRVIAEARRIVPDEISPEVAQVHHRMAKQAVSDGLIEPARESAERVIAIASVVGPTVELVEAMATMALATGVTGDMAGGLTLAAESRELALEAGLVSQVANTYRTEMLIIVNQAGRNEECVEASRRGLAYAEQHCGPRWRADFRLDLCLSYVEAGRLIEAEPHLEILLASDFDDLRRLTVLQAAGLHAIARDSLDQASEFLTAATEIASRYQSGPRDGAQLKLLAELARRQGRLGDASELIDEALEFQLAEDNLNFTRESIIEKIRIVTECIALGRAGVAQQLADTRALVADFEGSGPANVALRALMTSNSPRSMERSTERGPTTRSAHWLTSAIWSRPPKHLCWYSHIPRQTQASGGRNSRPTSSTCMSWRPRMACRRYDSAWLRWRDRPRSRSRAAKILPLQRGRQFPTTRTS